MSQATLNTAIPAAIVRKLRLVRTWKLWVHAANAVLLAAVVLFVAMGVAMLVDWLATLYDSRWRFVLTNAALSAAALTSLGWLMVAWRRGLPWARVAGDVDREFPELEERWTTMTRLKPAAAANSSLVHPAMLRRVATEAARWEPHVDPQQVVSLSPLIRTMLCFTAITLVLAVAVVLDARQTLVLLRRFWSPGSSISATELVNLPGNTVVGRGEPLLLAASVAGRPVERATLFLHPADDAERTIALVAHGSDPIEFSHNVRSVDEPFAYRFRAGDGQTEWYQVDVSDRPEIDKLKITVTPPAYTRREAKTFDRLPRHVSVMQNSELELALQPTIAVERVELRAGDKTLVTLTAGDDGWYRWRTKLTENLSFSPLLTESHGLVNRQAPRCDVTVVVDKPPAVKVLTPDDQMAVQPGDTVDITFAAQDDVGIGSAELVVYGTQEANGEPTPLATIPIPLADQAGERTVQGKVALDLSQFEVSDGVELSYQVRVREDRGPEGNNRSAATSAAATNATTPMPANGTQSAPNQTAAAENSATQSPASQSTPAASRGAENSSSQAPDRVASNTSPAAQPQPPASASQAGAAKAPTAAAPPALKMASVTQKDAMKPPAAGETPPTAAASSGKDNPSQPGRTAESDRRGLSSATPSQENQPANPPQMASDPSQRGSSQQAANSKGSSAKANQSTAASGASKPSSEKSSGGDPPPGDSMSRRSLDVAQSSSSQRMRLKVDQWAGSFSGQQRTKLELAIAPKLAALDEALAKAQRTAEGVLDAVAAEGKWRAAHDRDISSAEQATESGQKLIDELQQQSRETPYAFIGLQVADIGLAHVEPARSGFWTALQSEGDARQPVVRDALQHLVRARKLLAELRGQFERTRREFQLAESVERVKKMYQVYVENAMALLPTSAEDADRYRRKMAEFELSDEYLKRLQEVLKMREELRAELARILADDPRLLRRLMDSIRNRSENLREELAALVADQKEFNREVRAWRETEAQDRPRIAQLLLMRQLRKSAAIATATGELQDRYQAWLPLNRQSKDGNLAAATKTIQELATAANQLSAHSLQFIHEATRPKLVSPTVAGETPAGETPAAEAAPTAEPAPVATAPSTESLVAEGQKVYELAAQAELTLRQLSASDGDAEIAAFAAKRLADTRKVIADTSAWVRQVRAHQADKYSRAAEVEQYRLAMKTDELAGKLGSIEQSLSGLLERSDGSLPEPIAEKAREFLATLDKEASPNQLAAVYALHVDDFPRATERQVIAEGALDKAERLYDEMIKLAIKELDKLPVQDPIANLLDDPTLDELLAQLEQEQSLAELLGIPARPTNLRIVDDWLRSNGNLAMAARSRMWMQQQMRRDDERAKRQLDQAYRRAIARALKEAKPRDRIALSQRTKLSDWNRLVSQLSDDVGQGRDKAPPEQYRRAIEQYFAEISRAVAEEQKTQ